MKIGFWATALCLLSAAQPALAQNYFVGAARSEAFARIEAMKPIQAAYADQVMNTPGVYAFGIGLDKKSGQLIFEIGIDQALKVAPSFPETLGGVAVRIFRGEPPKASDGGAACVASVCHNDQLALPVQMGNSGRSVAAGSNCGSCTMGFKACDPANGTAVWVTAAHCASDATTCPGSAPIGSNAGHVSPGDTLFCGLASNVGTVYGHAPPVANGTTDATAIASDVTLTLSSVRDIGGVWNTTATALVGDSVRKSGRTTGLTTGVVALVNANVAISYNCGTLTLTQQIRIDDTVNNLFCRGGDSGSGVFDFDDPTHLVGLLVAGGNTTCWANDANNVLAALGLTMDHTDCAEDSCPAIEVSSGTPNEARTLSWIRLLRDDVLAESPLGRDWITTYYQVSDAWLALYASRPQLLDATTNALLANLGVLDAVAHQRPISITHARLNNVLALIDQHIQYSPQGSPLRAAFQTWRSQLNSSSVQAEFGVTVQ